jgi:hypothetical protein
MTESVALSHFLPDRRSRLYGRDPVEARRRAEAPRLCDRRLAEERQGGGGTLATPPEGFFMGGAKGSRANRGGGNSFAFVGSKR